MSQRVVMVMLCAWLFAGVLGAVLNGAGFVAALMGAILAGATFGDSMSPVSDTTIASSGTQHVDIGGTVRSRLRYAIPAGIAALILSAWLGGGGGNLAGPGVAAARTAVDGTAKPLALVLLVSPVLVIGLLLAKRHLIEALLLGILSATVLALLLGLLTPFDLLHIAPETFGATGIIVDGMQRAVGVSVFTLLLVALVGTLQATDVLDRLVRAANGRASSPRAAESWIVAVVSGAVLLTTHSVVAILAVGEFARRTGERFGISGYRRANLLDLTVCTWPFLLPYFLPTILAASASQSGVAYGMPALGAAAIGPYNTYAWALVVMVVGSVITGYGRTRVATALPE